MRYVTKSIYDTRTRNAGVSNDLSAESNEFVVSMIAKVALSNFSGVCSSTSLSCFESEVISLSVIGTLISSEPSAIFTAVRDTPRPRRPSPSRPSEAAGRGTELESDFKCYRATIAARATVLHSGRLFCAQERRSTEPGGIPGRRGGPGPGRGARGPDSEARAGPGPGRAGPVCQAESEL